jgi:hypothetical protein
MADMTGTVGKWHLHAEGGPDKGYIPITSQYPAFTAKAQGTGMDFADGFYAGPLPLTPFPPGHSCSRLACGA